MKISIITVCYNSEKTIRNTLESVASQTYDDLEYIVIDGGSSDSTLDIINTYTDKIAIIKSEKDKGLYDAINKGIACSTGDVVGIINSDDVFYNQDVVSDVAKIFRSSTDLDAIIGNIVQEDHTGRILRKYMSNTWQPSKLKQGFMPPHPSIFMYRKLFDTYGGYSLDYKIGADYELIIRYFLIHKIKWKYSGLITHRMLVGGISSSGWSSYKRISKEIIKALKSNGLKFHPLRIHFRFVDKLIERVFV
ncbi:MULTISPECIES: glycosyltransferase family 2 protein [unclassified Sphingobacterium]|uniref:glycosyltransferase family 2 protein n=1 Tax=unclassified Sphingobacterium TaxID=2609468 RepID=UPI0025DF0E55|nr:MULTISPECIES: glycosyltransferase family 2 protein [unclassified Sphingobacterium]